MSNKTEITIDTIVHATEDINKFYNSFEKLFGIDQEQFKIQEFEGHFDNPIIMLNTKITNQSEKILRKLSSGLSMREKDQVLETLEERMDDSSLYLRIDKQEFVEGKISLEEKNAIKLKIYTPVYKKKEILQEYKNLLNFN